MSTNAKSHGRRKIETQDVEVTLGELADSLAVLERIMAQPYKAGEHVSLFDRFAVTFDAVKAHVNKQSAYDVFQVGLLKEFGKFNEQSRGYQFESPSKCREFNEKMDEFREQVRTVRIGKFIGGDLDSIHISPALSYAELFALEWLVLGEEEELLS